MEKEDKKEIDELDIEVLRRLKKKQKKIVEKKIRKPSNYVKIANKLFSKISLSLYNKGTFASLKENLIQSNLAFLPVSYISVIFFTTLLSVILAVLILAFLLFFNIGIEYPFITHFTEDISLRFLKTFWIVFAIPIITFFVIYRYPTIEKNYIRNKINQELPFVTIHMASISGSMIEPSKMFEIIIATKEYKFISREFTKVINEINIYGYDLVSALRKSASNTSSYKLAELFNGIATAITSGGSLQKFFEKKAQNLLFEYRIEREKYTRTAETFMDIYISVVIAAPMILMLLLMMIKISGLGISLSTQIITLIIISGVSIINIIFLTILHIKQPQS